MNSASSDVEKVITLTTKIDALEKQISTERKWLVSVGLVLLGFLGYTNFLSLPKEVKETVEKQSPVLIKTAVDEKVKEELEEWRKNGGISQLAERASNTLHSIERLHGSATKIVHDLEEKQKHSYDGPDIKTLSVQIADLSRRLTEVQNVANEARDKAVSARNQLDRINAAGGAYRR